MAADRTTQPVSEGSARDADSDVPIPPGFEAYAAEDSRGVPAGSPGKDGMLKAEFTRTGEDTRLTHQYTRVPYHLGRELDYDRPFAAVRIQSPTAGIGQDDRLRMELTAGPDARAHVSSASSAKVFGMDHGFGQSRIEASAESGGYLELFPEPTILHAGSRFHQPVELSAAADGAVVYADVVVPGRLARGEIFEFDRYANVVEGVDPDGLAFRDAVDVSGDDELSGPGVFGPYSVLGTLYVLAPDVDAEALSDQLHERVSDIVASAAVDATTETPNQTTDGADTADEQATESDDGEAIDSGNDAGHSKSTSVVASASTLPRSGVVVRALGSTAPLVTDALASARDSVRRELVDQPAPGPRRW